jgi:hypothetical protein
VSDLGADNVVEEDPQDDVNGGEHHVAHARHDAPRANARAQQAQPAPRDRVCRPASETRTTRTAHDTTRAGGKAVHEEESAAAVVGGQEEEPTEDLDPDPVEGEARAHDDEHARPAHPRPSENDMKK